MRIFSRLAIAGSLFLLAASSPALASPDVPLTFTFQGAGYGHGVGMSQIGAEGQALAGKTAIEILNYYYTGVAVQPVEDDQMMRVNIGHLLSSFSIKTVSKLGQIQIFAGDIKDTTPTDVLRSVPTKANLSFTLLGNAGFPSVISQEGAVDPLPSGKSWTIRWTGTRYLSGSAAVVSVTNGKVSTKYRYGQIQVKLVKAGVLGFRLEVTNTVRLHDEYLWGIGEMPSSWPLAALQAQAIASRTYALHKGAAIKTACDCNIYGASQDQSFVGYSKETEAKYGKLWREAVNSTSTDESSGLAVLYSSAPISAFFFSSSGGASQSAKDVWGSPLPYAQSVPDPWSLDPLLNPRYASWLRPISEVVIARAFGLSDVVTLSITSRHESGTVASIIGTSSGGQSVSLTGGTFGSRAKLPSDWFDLAGPVISQVPPTPAPSLSPTPTPSATPSPFPTPT